eukprot:scaffold785_cov85-Isochrysis_galbana.AAC.3
MSASRLYENRVKSGGADIGRGSGSRRRTCAARKQHAKGGQWRLRLFSGRRMGEGRDARRGLGCAESRGKPDAPRAWAPACVGIVHPVTVRRRPTLQGWAGAR